MSSSQQEAQTTTASSATTAGQTPPAPEQITAAVEAAKAARRFQDAADALKREAALVRDPAQREKLWAAAYAKEKEAHGESKRARCNVSCIYYLYIPPDSLCVLHHLANKLMIIVMASGWGQGAGLGVGISSAVGMGLGNLVGALLSGVVAIPGVLVGSGVGAIHGPWYKLKDAVGAGGKKQEQGDGGHEAKSIEGGDSGSGSGDDGSEMEGEDLEAHKAIVDAARKLEEEEEENKKKKETGGASAVRDEANETQTRVDGPSGRPEESQVLQSSAQPVTKADEKTTEKTDGKESDS